MNASDNSGIQSILREAGAVDTGAQPFRYRFSSAGEPCSRALVYDAWDADDGKPPARTPGKLKWMLSAQCGTAVGAFLEAAAQRIGFETQAKHIFDTGAARVEGSSDILTPDAVIDLKLVGEKKWARIQKKPDQKHVMQVNGYAVESDRPRWVLLYIRACSIFDDSSELEWRAHSGNADTELAQALCGVWESVETHRKLRTLPERVFDAAPNKYPCGWCRHQSRCFTQSPKEG